MTGGASPRRRGDRFERQTLADLTRHGWLVIRLAGSGSGSRDTPLENTGVDLIAIRKGHRPLLVSCKLAGRVSPLEREAMMVVALRFGANALVASRPRPGFVQYRRLGAVDGAT